MTNAYRDIETKNKIEIEEAMSSLAQDMKVTGEKIKEADEALLGLIRQMAPALLIVVALCYLALALGLLVGCGLVVVDPTASPDAGVDGAPSSDAGLCYIWVNCCDASGVAESCWALCEETTQAPACVPGAACVEPGMICVPPGSSPWWP